MTAVIAVEWMDGEKRRYPGVDMSESGTDGVLRLYGPAVYGRRELVAAVPIGNVREWRQEE